VIGKNFNETSVWGNELLHNRVYYDIDTLYDKYEKELKYNL